MARQPIHVTVKVTGTPNRELIFNIYRKYGVPQPSCLREKSGEGKGNAGR